MDPKLIQRIEGGAILVAALCVYGLMNLSWLWFAVLLLSIDLSMLGYVAGNRVGAVVYNIGHSLTVPLLLLVGGLGLDALAVTGFALIWIAHIGLDRAFGYGLKLPSGFQDTHLGRIGRRD